MTKNAMVVSSFFATVLLACNTNESGNHASASALERQIDNLTDTIPDDSILFDFDKNDTIQLFLHKESLAPTSKVDVMVHTIRGYGQNKIFASNAADTLEVVLNSKGFKRAVENTLFHMNRGMTSSQIYEHIMKAHEEVGLGGKDGVVDIRLRTITKREDGARWIRACTVPRSGWITVGKDGGNSGVMATCINWVGDRAAERDYASMAGHIMHENLHILGFSHKGASNKKETVPYKVGYIIRRLVQNPSARS